jgi:hypothetical protein
MRHRGEDMENQILRFSAVDYVGSTCVLCYDAEFIEDFGTIKKGSKFFQVEVNYEGGWLIAYGDDGNPSAKIEMRLVAV